MGTVKESLERTAKVATREELEKIFVAAEMAKNALRQVGIGVTGMGILETAEEAVAVLVTLER